MYILILEDDVLRRIAFRKKLEAFLPDAEVIMTGDAQTAIEYLNEMTFGYLYLDHDLGEEEKYGNGYQVACWLEEHRSKQPKHIIIHSMNNVAAKRMKQALPTAELKPGWWI